MKILIVDDEKDFVELLKDELEAAGHNTAIAYDGEEALKMINDDPSIHFVISDWMMPNLSGPDLCRRIREANFPNYIYFILLTAKGSKDNISRAMELGADDFISKPYDNEELHARIKAGERILHLEQKLDSRNRELRKAYKHMRKDLDAAAIMQNQILPSKDFLIDGFQFDWLFIPTSILAGDIFNIMPIDKNRMAFYLLDVSGHGVPSAILAFMVNETLTAQTKRGTGDRQSEAILSPSRVMSYLNRRFMANDDNVKYFTMVYGIIDRSRNKLTLTSAGHPHPIYIKKGGGLLPMTAGGVPIGIMENSVYEEQEIDFREGDRIFIYSDGITECSKQGKELFSQERLLERIQGQQASPLGDIVRQLKEDLNSWRENREFDDDVSALIIERT